jgi:hypothetical protein
MLIRSKMPSDNDAVTTTMRVNAALLELHDGGAEHDGQIPEREEEADEHDCRPDADQHIRSNPRTGSRNPAASRNIAAGKQKLISRKAAVEIPERNVPYRTLPADCSATARKVRPCPEIRR